MAQVVSPSPLSSVPPTPEVPTPAVSSPETTHTDQPTDIVGTDPAATTSDSVEMDAEMVHNPDPSSSTNTPNLVSQPSTENSNGEVGDGLQSSPSTPRQSPLPPMSKRRSMVFVDVPPLTSGKDNRVRFDAVTRRSGSVKSSPQASSSVIDSRRSKRIVRPTAKSIAYLQSVASGSKSTAISFLAPSPSIPSANAASPPTDVSPTEPDNREQSLEFFPPPSSANHLYQPHLDGESLVATSPTYGRKVISQLVRDSEAHNDSDEQVSDAPGSPYIDGTAQTIASRTRSSVYRPRTRQSIVSSARQGVVSRPRGRPRKDGLPPGSVRSPTRLTSNRRAVVPRRSQRLSGAPQSKNRRQDAMDVDEDDDVEEVDSAPPAWQADRSDAAYESRANASGVPKDVLIAFDNHLPNLKARGESGLPELYEKYRTFWVPQQSHFFLLMSAPRMAKPRPDLTSGTRWHPDSTVTLCNPSFFFWDPLPLVPGGIRCPRPQCTKLLKHGGFGKAPERVHIVSPGETSMPSTTEPSTADGFWLIVAQYRCPSCVDPDSPTGTFMYMAWDEVVLSMLPPVLRAEFPAYTLGKRLIAFDNGPRLSLRPRSEEAPSLSIRQADQITDPVPTTVQQSEGQRSTLELPLVDPVQSLDHREEEQAAPGNAEGGEEPNRDVEIGDTSCDPQPGAVTSSTTPDAADYEDVFPRREDGAMDIDQLHTDQEINETSSVQPAQEEHPDSQALQDSGTPAVAPITTDGPGVGLTSNGSSEQEANNAQTVVPAPFKAGTTTKFSAKLSGRERLEMFRSIVKQASVVKGAGSRSKATQAVMGRTYRNSLPPMVSSSYAISPPAVASPSASESALDQSAPTSALSAPGNGAIGPQSPGATPANTVPSPSSSEGPSTAIPGGPQSPPDQASPQIVLVPSQAPHTGPSLSQKRPLPAEFTVYDQTRLPPPHPYAQLFHNPYAPPIILGSQPITTMYPLLVTRARLTPPEYVDANPPSRPHRPSASPQPPVAHPPAVDPNQSDARHEACSKCWTVGCPGSWAVQNCGNPCVGCRLVDCRREHTPRQNLCVVQETSSEPAVDGTASQRDTVHPPEVRHTFIGNGAESPFPLNMDYVVNGATATDQMDSLSDPTVLGSLGLQG